MQLTKAFSILERVPASSSGFLELYTPSSETVSEETVNFSGLLESLRVRIQINSLTETPIPAGLDELGDVEALEAYKNYQWEAERIHLSLFRRKGSGDRLKIGTVPMLKRSPFYVVDLMPYLTRQVVARFATGDSLDVAVEDAGYGFLTADDDVVVFGEGLEEADVYSSPQSQASVDLSPVTLALSNLQASTDLISEQIGFGVSGDVIFPTLTSTFVDVDPDKPTKVTRFPSGLVLVEAAVISQGNGARAMMTLPEGWRPAQILIPRVVADSGNPFPGINSDGVVSVAVENGTTLFMFDSFLSRP